MEKRFYVKVGNCFVKFCGLWHEPKMVADYKRATPHMTGEEARNEAVKRGVRNYTIICKEFL